MNRKRLEALMWLPAWDCADYQGPDDDVPILDEMLQQIDQPKAPRLYRALAAMGSDYLKGMA